MTDLSWTNEVATVDSDGAATEKLSVTYPNSDLVDHDPMNLRCACVPNYKITIGFHGKPGCLCILNEVVHHSLDGRELFE